MGVNGKLSMIGGRARRWPRTRRLPVAAGAAAVAITIAVAAYGVVAASPASAAPVYRGCYATHGGALLMLARPGHACQPGERAATWSSSSIRWRGTWHSNVAYDPGNVVSALGSSYIATRPSTGKYPPYSPGVWSVLAAGGQPGGRGAQGATGPAGPTGAAGAPGGGNYAEFYNAPGSPVTVASGADFAFPTAGPENGSIVSATGGSGEQWTFNQAGTYTVSVCVPISSGGDFQLLLNASLVAGTIAGTNAQATPCETVVVTASSGDTLSVENPSGSSETGAVYSEWHLLIQQIG